MELKELLTLLLLRDFSAFINSFLLNRLYLSNLTLPKNGLTTLIKDIKILK